MYNYHFGQYVRLDGNVFDNPDAELLQDRLNIINESGHEIVSFVNSGHNNWVIITKE